MALADCLKKLGNVFHPSELEELRATVDRYVAEGAPPDSAERSAVAAMLRDAHGEHQDLMNRIAQHLPSKEVTNEKTNAPNQEVRSGSGDAERSQGRDAGSGERDTGTRGREDNAQRGPEVGREAAGQPVEGVSKDAVGSDKVGDSKADAKEEVDQNPYVGQAKLYDVSAVAGEAGVKAAKWMFGGDYSQTRKDFQAVVDWAKGLLTSKKGKPLEPGEGDPRSIGRRLFNGMFASADGDIRSLYNNLKSRGIAAETIKRVADMFHATAGKADDTGRTYHEQIALDTKKAQNEIDKIAEALKASGATDEQVWRQITNPNSRQGKAGEVANKVAEFFKSWLDRQKASGVDIGDVGDGYFKRVLDRSKVFEKPAAFIEAATKAYRDAGMSADEARVAAEQYWFRQVYGSDGRPGNPGINPKAKETKAREFGPSADTHLADFYVKDIIGAMQNYASGAIKRSAIAERFGDRFSRWNEIEDAMRAEGAAEALPALRDFVETSAGLKNYGVGATQRIASSWARTFFSLGSLTWSASLSLGELAMPVMRANADVASLWKGYTRFLNEMVTSGRDKNYYRQLAEDLNMIAGAHYGALSAERFGSGNVSGSYQARAIEKYFQRNLLEPLTNFNVALNTSVAGAFIDKNAKRAAAGDGMAVRELSELGITKERAGAMNEWLSKLDGQMPTAEQVAAAGEVGRDYVTALLRFSNQTTMVPNASIKAQAANNPGVIGLLYHLQSFNYAFSKNVLGRIKNRAIDAVKGDDMSAAERMHLGLAVLPGMALLAAAQYAIGLARDEVSKQMSGKQQDRKLTPIAEVERAVSRAGLFGALDPYIQAASGVKYSRTIGGAAEGPVIGTMSDFATSLTNYLTNNNPNTNAAERSLARTGFRTLVEPGVNLAMTSLPVNPATAMVTVAALPYLRNRAVDAIAGDRPEVPAKEIKGLSENIYDSVTGRSSSGGGAQSGYGKSQYGHSGYGYSGYGYGKKTR